VLPTHSEPSSATFKDVRVRTPNQNKFKASLLGAKLDESLSNGKVPAYKAIKIEGDLVGTRLNPT